ncbi:MAG: Gfo/Idh/MocA family oxidoreductase [Balneolales bacterium]|nr:Gfo/Idh/MocA family oxidoreductase [Balneolales bacterium]
MKSLTIGLVGFGGFGKFLLKALEETPNITVAGIADPELDDHSSYEGIDTYTKWETMILNKHIEALCIATPPSTHSSIAISAMKKGLHVLIEKPLAITPGDAEQIIRTSEETDRVALINFMQRCNPVLSGIRGMYSQGLLGELEHFSIHNYAQDEFLPANHWFWDSEISGGILIEHAVHFIDIAHWFLKEPIIKSVRGWQQFRDNGQRDRMGLTAEYQSGCIVNHYHSFSGPDFFEQTKLMMRFSLAEFDLKGWIPESGEFNLLASSSLIGELKSNSLFSIEETKEVNQTPIRDITFNYTKKVKGRISAKTPKEVLYTNALISIFSDFYYTIRNSEHQPIVHLKDGLKAVEVAYAATETAAM